MTTSCASVNKHLAAIQHNKEYEYFEGVVSLNKEQVLIGTDKIPNSKLSAIPGSTTTFSSSKSIPSKISAASVKLEKLVDFQDKEKKYLIY